MSTFQAKTKKKNDKKKDKAEKCSDTAVDTKVETKINWNAMKMHPRMLAINPFLVHPTSINVDTDLEKITKEDANELKHGGEWLNAEKRSQASEGDEEEEDEGCEQNVVGKRQRRMCNQASLVFGDDILGCFDNS